MTALSSPFFQSPSCSYNLFSLPVTLIHRHVPLLRSFCWVFPPKVPERGFGAGFFCEVHKSSLIFISSIILSLTFATIDQCSLLVFPYTYKMLHHVCGKVTKVTLLLYGALTQLYTLVEHQHSVSNQKFRLFVEMPLHYHTRENLLHLLKLILQILAFVPPVKQFFGVYLPLNNAFHDIKSCYMVPEQNNAKTGMGLFRCIYSETTGSSTGCLEGYQFVLAVLIECLMSTRLQHVLPCHLSLQPGICDILQFWQT